VNPLAWPYHAPLSITIKALGQALDLPRVTYVRAPPYFWAFTMQSILTNQHFDDVVPTLFTMLI